LGPVNHPAFSLVHFAGPGQHQFAVGDKGFGNVALRSVIARCVIPRGGLRFAHCKDAGVMVISDPSCNTDQGVVFVCECSGVKPLRVMKVNVGESFGAPPTDPDVLGWI